MLELPGQFQILYYAQDGSLQGSSARWEESMQFPADAATTVTFLPQAQNVQAMAGTNEINLSGQYALHMDSSTEKGMPMVTGLNVGQEREKDPQRPSLILCRPNGETFWSMAKRTGSTVADIRRANRLTGENAENRMLLIPIE